jgi:hypothetical protein
VLQTQQFCAPFFAVLSGGGPKLGRAIEAAPPLKIAVKPTREQTMVGDVRGAER